MLYVYDHRSRVYGLRLRVRNCISGSEAQSLGCRAKGTARAYSSGSIVYI